MIKTLFWEVELTVWQVYFSIVFKKIGYSHSCTTISTKCWFAFNINVLKQLTVAIRDSLLFSFNFFSWLVKKVILQHWRQLHQFPGTSFNPLLLKLHSVEGHIASFSFIYIFLLVVISGTLHSLGVIWASFSSFLWSPE